ncbi:hypothetical protein Ruko_14870 [Ruthenibacterium sp. TH_2024_36131]
MPALRTFAHFPARKEEVRVDKPHGRFHNKFKKDLAAAALRTFSKWKTMRCKQEEKDDETCFFEFETI